MFEPLLEVADSLPEDTDFLRDRLEVFQGQEMIRGGSGIVKSATPLNSGWHYRQTVKRRSVLYKELMRRRAK